MNERKMRELQKQFGYDVLQALINSGAAWNSGGSITKKCKAALVTGACYLPYREYVINIFNTVPSRYQVSKNSIGSINKSKKYWSDQWNVSNEIAKNITQTLTA